MRRGYGLRLAATALGGCAVLAAVLLPGSLRAQAPVAPSASYVVHDSHLHLTNYIQEGPVSGTS